MSDSFSISRARCSLPLDAAIRTEILAHTGDDHQAASILRSIERYGADDSIRHYEMTRKKRRGSAHDARSVSWSVRAVRT